ncbi:MAG: ABC transporter permease [Gammaproteobacteria bacterium]|nr:ABC transporter permease [Gammaproteobacteria bacterium]
MHKTLLGLALRDLHGSRAMRSLWLFCASLVLGIILVSACANLLELVKQGFAEQQRHLFGGDLQISQRTPLSKEQLAWIQANGDVSLLLELRTMLGTENGEFTVVELQSVDTAYPLYGEVELSNSHTLHSAMALSDDGLWGAAFDPVLIEQLGLKAGQVVTIGELEMELRATIIQQPDRSLRADVRGPPVLVHKEALTASGLLQPTSLVDYDYRVRISDDPAIWRDRLSQQFPTATWEVQTIQDRSDLVSDRLNKVASVLLLIGFSTLFIGGLGVSNSINAWLQTKFSTVATLQSLGFKDAQVAWIFVGQVIILGAIASAVGAVLGACIAWFTALSLSARLPMDTGITQLLLPTLLSIVFGVLTSLLFALPLLGRTLKLPTGHLIRGLIPDSATTPKNYRRATLAVFIILVALLLLLIPEPWVAIGFVLVFIGLLLLLELIIKGIRTATRWLSSLVIFKQRVAVRLASASLSRKSSSLRPMLLSLGTALTLIVAASLVIAATVNTLNSTVPGRAPSLVFYDLQQPQVDSFTQLVQSIDGFQEMAVVPLVLGRLTKVNGETLSSSNSAQRALEANDEHKLSYRNASIDNTTVDRGAWWPDDYDGSTLVAMEDREADQLGLQVGDNLMFSILGEDIPATLTAIYSQARFETSFWLEAVFSPGVLDPFITRNIGSIRVDAGKDVSAMSAVATEYPNVVMVRTAKVLAAARSVLASASWGVLAIAIVSLAASILVMGSVVAVSRQRQLYEATVMHAVGTRTSLIFRSVIYEYLLLALTLTLFATTIGTVIAWVVLEYWLKLTMGGLWVLGLTIAIITSCLCLLSGALWLLKSLSVSPAMLLKSVAR